MRVIKLLGPLDSSSVKWESFLRIERWDTSNSQGFYDVGQSGRIFKRCEYLGNHLFLPMEGTHTHVQLHTHTPTLRHPKLSSSRSCVLRQYRKISATQIIQFTFEFYLFSLPSHLSTQKEMLISRNSSLKGEGSSSLESPPSLKS